MAASNVYSVAYGIDDEASIQKFTDTADAALHSLTLAAVPGAFLVESISILKYIPEWFPGKCYFFGTEYLRLIRMVAGARFKRQAAEWRKMATEFAMGPYRAAKANIVSWGITQTAR
jgi:hypothetical protein